MPQRSHFRKRVLVRRRSDSEYFYHAMVIEATSIPLLEEDFDLELLLAPSDDPVVSNETVSGISDSIFLKLGFDGS